MIGWMLVGVLIGSVVTLGIVLVWFSDDAERWGRSLEDAPDAPNDWSKEPTEFPMIRVRKP